MESMPEYRRFIAYFYEYIDGRKGNNAGFAKVELRSGMWRILFRLNSARSPEPPVQVYGFVREQEYLLGLLMGTMRPGTQMIEEWAYHAGNPIWKQKYVFSDLAGIWIQCGDGCRYVTVWDDEPIEMNRFVLELPEESFQDNRTVAETEEAGELEDLTEVREPEGSGRPAKAEAAQGQEISEEVREQRKPAKAEEVQEPRKERSLAEPETHSGEALFADEVAVTASQLSWDGIYTQLSGQGDINGCGESEKNGFKESRLEKNELENNESEEKRFEQSRIQENKIPENKAPERKAAWIAWNTILQRRESFEPFEDEQFETCLKIQPCDLILLRQMGCQVGRSSFLLHGFYQYHHLLLGKQKTGRFVIGVPGLYNPQERYMAQIFGFPDFKTAKWRDHGMQFGYWYRPIDVQNDQETASSVSSSPEMA